MYMALLGSWARSAELLEEDKRHIEEDEQDKDNLSLLFESLKYFPVRTRRYFTCGHL